MTEPVNKMATHCTMFVHYVGDFARYTFEDGLFYVCDRDELGEHERAVCEQGGGFLPFDPCTYLCASETGRAGNQSLQEFVDSAPTRHPDADRQNWAH